MECFGLFCRKIATKEDSISSMTNSTLLELAVVVSCFQIHQVVHRLQIMMDVVGVKICVSFYARSL